MEENYIPLKRIVRITHNHGQFLVRIPLRIAEEASIAENDKLLFEWDAKEKKLLVEHIRAEKRK